MLQSSVEILNLGETRPEPDHYSKPVNLDDDIFTVFSIFKIKKDYHKRLLKQFEKHIAHTRREDGCILFDLYTVDGTDDTLAAYEHWRNASALWDIHSKQPYTVETDALIKEAVIDHS
ncbi:antibiotic biosynthesis monooxygenase [Desulfobacterales bacterium HSG16]|nr:antibiotic biosynthesis monooxygenase [Desulfobacterales bacterium HSG16]